MHRRTVAARLLRSLQRLVKADSTVEQDTEKRYKMPNGEYHPDRVKLHNKIIDHFRGGGNEAELHKFYGDYAHDKPQKHAVFMMGGPGSGKSHFANHKFLKHPRFVAIAPDEIKAHLPEYDPKAPQHVHEESVHIAQGLLHKTMQEGKSFVYDGTASNPPSVRKRMEAAKANGYSVHLHMVHAPLDVAIKRANQRMRKVPESIIKEGHAKIASAFSQLKGVADTVHVHQSLNPPAPSPYATRRMQLQSALARALTEALGEALLEKGVHMRRRVRVYLGKKHCLKGYVVNGALHVEDIVHGGASERKMTGQVPHLKPIPLTDLRKRGAKIRTAGVKLGR